MSIEAILYGVIPVVFGIVSLAGSSLVTWNTRSVIQCCLSVIVFICMFWSLYVLYGVFFLGARPTYLPHVVILIAFAIFAAQSFYFLKRNNGAA